MVCANNKTSEKNGIFTVSPHYFYGKGRHKYSSAGKKILDDVADKQLEREWEEAGIWDRNLPRSEAGINALQFGLLGIFTSRLTTATKAPNAPVVNVATKTRGTSLTRLLESLGKNTKQASEFFGWGNGTKLTKSISDFTRKELLKNGWTKENLVKLARAYNDQIVKAQLKGAQNAAAVVRRDLAMALARTFF